MLATQRPKLVAVTGTIGSGKSSVVEVLRGAGAVIIDADVLARQVVAPGTPGLKRVIAEFGVNFLTSDARLDRRALGTLVFSDTNQLRRLEAILHPLIRSAFEVALAEATSSNPPMIVYDVPLLFEANSHSNTKFDAIVVVQASKEVCLQRVMQRDSLSIQQAEQRLSRQLSAEQKIARADYVVRNEGSLADLKMETQRLYADLMNDR